MRRVGGGQRFLATVLFTDIVGSTELAARAGDARWRRVLNDFYALVRRELRRTHGRELDTAGDGLFAAFDSPGAALDCARAIVRAAPSIGVSVWRGVHTGEVERIGRKVGGIAVHIDA
jgi:class 3 adenylate cyclase